MLLLAPSAAVSCASRNEMLQGRHVGIVNAQHGRNIRSARCQWRRILEIARREGSSLPPITPVADALILGLILHFCSRFEKVAMQGQGNLAFILRRLLPKSPEVQRETGPKTGFFCVPALCKRTTTTTPAVVVQLVHPKTRCQPGIIMPASSHRLWWLQVAHSR